jgi:hypothetical protein
MWSLYGFKTGSSLRKLLATFGSEQQLRAYVSWATLSQRQDGTSKFEQGSVLAGFDRWEAEQGVLITAPPASEGFALPPHGEEGGADLPHNPSPSML